MVHSRPSLPQCSRKASLTNGDFLPKVLVAKTAANNSILGIVIAFRGANLDFAMIKEQWTLPFTLICRRYETAP